MPAEFIKVKSALRFIEEASRYYKNAPEWFCRYLEYDIYIRLTDEPKTVTLPELLQVQMLFMDGDWVPECVAVNRIYKLFKELGRDTTGIIGY